MARSDGWSFDLRSDTMRAVTAVAVFLCFAGWVIALAGVSALQHDCGRNDLPAVRLFPLSACAPALPCLAACSDVYLGIVHAAVKALCR